MKGSLFLFSILLMHSLIAQPTRSVELSVPIEEVTVFLQGALIVRSGAIELGPGKSVLQVKGLSPHLDAKSIQVKSTGDFTVLSVNHELDFLAEKQKDQKVDSLKQLIEILEVEIATNTYRLQVLNEKQSLLNENKKLAGDREGVSIEVLSQAIDFYDQQLMQIKEEELRIQLSNKELVERKSKLERQISEVTSQDDLPASNLSITVDADTRTRATFTIAYFVANAGWFPNYDLRVQSVAEPIALTYKADVYQNTGVDWENVKLKFSNANPNQSGSIPQLSTWYLNYARNTIYRAPAYGQRSDIRKVTGQIVDEYGEPLIGANILVQGTSTGTITDMNGNYSIMIPEGADQLTISYTGYDTQQVPITSENMNTVLRGDIQLDEMVVTGYGGRGNSRAKFDNVEVAQEAKIVSTSTIENQTSVEFELETPYTIKSDGSKLSVDLNKYDIDATYEYYAVPKLDKDAFLMARIIDWEKYNLLVGEANLFFEDAYVGRTILEANALRDTLDISLGRDKSIVLGRNKIDTYSKVRSIGSNRIETRGFEVLAKNKKAQPIKLTIIDQIPTPAISDISVTALELSGGKLDEQTGKITWEWHIDAGEQAEIILSYEVKYPKKERVVLE
jgi:hypothetical protein